MIILFTGIAGRKIRKHGEILLVVRGHPNQMNQESGEMILVDRKKVPGPRMMTLLMEGRGMLAMKLLPQMRPVVGMMEKMAPRMIIPGILISPWMI